VLPKVDRIQAQAAATVETIAGGASSLCTSPGGWYCPTHGRLTLPWRACPVCGCAGYTSAQAEPGCVWARCSSCGLLWDLDARPEWPHLRYQQDGGKLPAGATYDEGEPKIRRAREGGAGVVPWHQIYDLVLAATGTKRGAGYGVLLDAGFGGGEILDYARTRHDFARVAGVEIGRDFVLAAAARGHEVYYHDLAEGPPPALAGQCDLVISNELVEHLVDPPAWVAGVRGCLSLTGLWWAGFTSAEHLSRLDLGEWMYWTVTAVATLIERAGLEIARMDIHGHKIRTLSRLPRLASEHAVREARGAVALAAREAQP